MAPFYKSIFGNVALSPNSAAGRVDAVLAPQLAQQAAYGEHQNAVIRAFANSLLGRLEPVAGQVGADYDAAIQQIGGLSGQAAQYLSGQNPTASQQALTSSVGAPAAQQAQQAQALSDTFQGGAGVLAFTGGTIPGSQLAGDKAAAQAQARTLPAIGALKGQQDLSSALWQQSQDRNTLEATRPGLVQQAQQQIDQTNQENARIALQRRELEDRERADRAAAAYQQQQLKAAAKDKAAKLGLEYAKAAQSAADKAIARKETKAYRDAYLKHLQAGDSERVAHNKASEAAGNARLAISQQNADTSAFNAQTSRANAQTSRINASKPQDHSIPGGGIVRVYPDGSTRVLRKPKPTAAGGVKPPTASQIANQVQKWRTGSPTSVTRPVLDPDTGKPATNPDTGRPITTTRTETTGQLGFLQAYKRLVAQGVPDKKAREYLATAWQRGEEGRAWLSNEEQYALRRAGLSPRPKVVNGHPVLSPAQVAALRSARKMPPGQLTREGAFVIAQTF